MYTYTYIYMLYVCTPNFAGTNSAVENSHAHSRHWEHLKFREIYAVDMSSSLSA